MGSLVKPRRGLKNRLGESRNQTGQVQKNGGENGSFDAS